MPMMPRVFPLISVPERDVRQLRDRVAVLTGAVGHRDAMARGRRLVHVIHADAMFADHLQLPRTAEELFVYAFQSKQVSIRIRDFLEQGRAVHAHRAVHGNDPQVFPGRKFRDDALGNYFLFLRQGHEDLLHGSVSVSVEAWIACVAT
jgi:hypothetical protein